MKIGASYSTLCQDELLLELVPQYQIEEPLTCRFWQRGVNDTYQVHCVDAIYSLRVYRHGLRSIDEIKFEMAALQYVHENGAKVAYPMAKRDGSFISNLDSPEGARYAVLTTHAEGAPPRYADAEDARLFGTSVAELHQVSEGFETDYKRPRLESDFLLDHSLDIVRPHVKENKSNLKYLEDTASEVRRIVTSVSTSELDIGFCHGDCHGYNVHSNDGSLTHFDFDCCGLGLRIYDLATFNWNVWHRSNGTELWLSFLEGYQSIRRISDEDLALVDALMVIRHIWFMSLHMGNAKDFGYGVTSEGYIDHQIGYIRNLLSRNE